MDADSGRMRILAGSVTSLFRSNYFWPRPWSQPPEIGLSLGLVALASASRFWPRLTSERIYIYRIWTKPHHAPQPEPDYQCLKQRVYRRQCVAYQFQYSANWIPTYTQALQWAVHNRRKLVIYSNNKLCFRPN